MYKKLFYSIKLMISITNKAKQKLVELIKKENQSVFLYLKGGGCNGFTYTFKVIENKNINKLDEKISLSTDLDIDISMNTSKNLYLCNKSLMFILGTKIDYIEDIMGSRFDFKNDLIDSKCGCGTSVNFK